LLLHFGQARNVGALELQVPVRPPFSRGFYPLSDCGSQSCAVVWIVWHSSLRRLRPHSTLLVRRPRKRPPT
jgi:hypothetical protein